GKWFQSNRSTVSSPRTSDGSSKSTLTACALEGTKGWPEFLSIKCTEAPNDRNILLQSEVSGWPTSGTVNVTRCVASRNSLPRFQNPSQRRPLRTLFSNRSCFAFHAP